MLYIDPTGTSCHEDCGLKCDLVCHALHVVVCHIACHAVPPPGNIACMLVCDIEIGGTDCMLACNAICSKTCEDEKKCHGASGSW